LALAEALLAYAHRTTTDDCSSLAEFAANHPQSRWTASLLLHLGVEYYNYGYFSKALDAWERSWAQFQESAYPLAKPQADRALGELARMYARIGRTGQLSDLLETVKNRDVGGPGAQLVHSTQQALWIMLNKPDYAFSCGPSALDRILLHFAPAKAGNPVLLDCKSGTNGFSLNQVAEISQKLDMKYQMAYREAGAPLVLPSVVHWKVGHYAALIERRGDRILVQDYTFPASVWISERALNEESSGYFLVPPGGLPAGWRAVSDLEGQTVWGRGQTGGQDPKANDPCHDTKSGGSGCSKCNQGGFVDRVLSTIAGFFGGAGASGGMTTYTMHTLLASLNLEDTPVQFASPVGPPVAFTAVYNQTEADQPANFYYSNLGPLWDFGWLSYVTDNPGTPGADVSLYGAGGGELEFNNFNWGTQSYAPEVLSQEVLALVTNASYELRFPDGSRREYNKSDGSTGSSRRVFLTRMIDPYGNAVLLNYDSQLRITNVVNAIGQAMTLSYTNTAFPFAITSVADPFGRTAQLLYNTNGLLVQITDVLGLTSQYVYGAHQFITNLITPYGTTTFATGATNGGTYLTATDPLGGTEAVEYSQSLPVTDTLPAAQVPHGLSTFNLFLSARNTFYWDKKAFAQGPWDWRTAHIYHWLHKSPSGNLSSRILESQKDPLENRVWYNYPGESTNFGAPYYLDAAYTGASARPSVIARVMDDGTTQLSTYAYNANGNMTNTTDPMGRNFTFTYASNNVDLVAASMTRGGKHELLLSAVYNSQHQPLTITDASGQTTTNTYNVRGQLLSTVDPLGETTTYAYDSNGFLLSITGPLQSSNDVIRFNYDGFNRVKTVTDTEGYTVAFTYDNFDRPLSMTYPDGTSQQFVYSNLDLVATSDRLGRWTTNTYNANRQLVQLQDPLGRITRYQYCTCGALEAIFDPMNRATSWDYDLQSRPIAKHFADGSTVSWTYEQTTSRLWSQIDEKGQQTVYQRYRDDHLASVSYPNASVPTPTVTYTYDTNYNRLTGMHDGTGTTIYTYNPITPSPGLGAGQLASVSGPVPTSLVTYQYDALGRLSGQAINGVGQAFTYDVLGRPEVVTNVLGSFRYGYVGATDRPGFAAYPNGQTNLYSYYGNLGDQRLLQIQNAYPNGSLLSAFGYAYDSVGEIIAWTNQWDNLPSRVWLAAHDAADQLTNVISVGGTPGVTNYSYGYDFAGNRILAKADTMQDGFQYNSLNQLTSHTAGPTNAITYEWDGAQRLTAINQGTHQSQFSYDGLGRRARLVEMENGAVVSDNYFVWCGNVLCEERDPSGGTVVRRYFPQGESRLGAGTTNLFYTRDHLGSVREALDSSGALQVRNDYDPYGQQVSLVNKLATSFGYGGYFRHEASGLDFAVYRGFDPSLGRWLNRDPLGEAAGLNLYGYVNNDPVRLVDPSGQFPLLIVVALAALGAVAWFAIGQDAHTLVDKMKNKEHIVDLLRQKQKIIRETGGSDSDYDDIEIQIQNLRREDVPEISKDAGKLGVSLEKQAVESVAGNCIPEKVGAARDILNTVAPGVLKEDAAPVEGQ